MALLNGTGMAGEEAPGGMRMVPKRCSRAVSELGYIASGTSPIRKANSGSEVNTKSCASFST